MIDPRFYVTLPPLTLSEILDLTGARCSENADLSVLITACAPLDQAGGSEAAYFSDLRYRSALESCKAGLVFINEAHRALVPDHCLAVIHPLPQGAWSVLAHHIHRLRDLGAEQISDNCDIHPTVSLSHGVVVGPGAAIGEGTRIGPYTVIGAGVQIGRHCQIESHVSLKATLCGDRVRIAAGAKIGEQGFGVTAVTTGLIDVPQLGRVILQDDVSIGAASCIDRGAFADTVVGERTKIDNLVQVAHNVQIGRNCILAAHTGLSGSVIVGDGAMFGGRAGVVDHMTIGAGAKIAAGAAVLRSVPPKETWSGYPARPVRQFLRETAYVTHLLQKPGNRDPKP